MTSRRVKTSSTKNWERKKHGGTPVPVVGEFRARGTVSADQAKKFFQKGKNEGKQAATKRTCKGIVPKREIVPGGLTQKSVSQKVSQCLRALWPTLIS